MTIVLVTKYLVTLSEELYPLQVHIYRKILLLILFHIFVHNVIKNKNLLSIDRIENSSYALRANVDGRTSFSAILMIRQKIKIQKYVHR